MTTNRNATETIAPDFKIDNGWDEVVEVTRITERGAYIRTNSFESTTAHITPAQAKALIKALKPLARLA